MCLPNAFNIWKGFMTLTEKQASYIIMLNDVIYWT